MNLFSEQVYNELPEFLKGDEIIQELEALQTIYTEFFEFVKPVFTERNALTCQHDSLSYLAADRCIDKIHGESDDSHRARVANAIQAQLLSGTFDGFLKIVKLFGINNADDISFGEGEDWDMVILPVDAEVSTVPLYVLKELAGEKYGRTGRIFTVRYDLKGAIFRPAPGVLMLSTLNFPVAMKPDPVDMGYTEEGTVPDDQNFYDDNYEYFFDTETLEFHWRLGGVGIIQLNQIVFNLADN